MAMASAPAPGAGVLPPLSSGAATTAAVMKPGPTPIPPAPRMEYTGVQRSPTGGWTAHVLDPDHQGGAVRVIGPFPDAHAAALAHDRVAIALHGAGSARANFRPAFHAIELQFLERCRRARRGSVVDVCGIVADGTYEARYAAFLRAVFGLEQYGEFMDVMIEFYIDRAAEIGEEALVAGGEKLVAKFVAMHRNRALDPAWLGWYHRKVTQFMMEKQRQQQLQQRAGGCVAKSQCMEHRASNNSNSSVVLSRE